MTGEVNGRVAAHPRGRATRAIREREAMAANRAAQRAHVGELCARFENDQQRESPDVLRAPPWESHATDSQTWLAMAVHQRSTARPRGGAPRAIRERPTTAAVPRSTGRPRGGATLRIHDRSSRKVTPRLERARARSVANARRDSSILDRGQPTYAMQCARVGSDAPMSDRRLNLTHARACHADRREPR